MGKRGGVMQAKERELTLKQLALALLHAKTLCFKNNHLRFSMDFNLEGATT